jgi:hypothetical protein
MIITLTGGPEDGKELDISWDLWRRGTIRVPVASKPKVLRELIEPKSVDTFQILTYHRQRWNPGYACVVEDFDEVSIRYACEPLFKWLYFDSSHNWSAL